MVADDIPSGTVTFLFTDIEGSTRLWETHRAEMEVALERHDELMRDVIGANRGYVFSTAGDAFVAAFSRAVEAIEAARVLQAAVSAEPWPEATPIRVRIGIHTGETQERDGDYFGPVLNRTARICSAGHGGQTLVSSVTASLVTGEGLVDLGEHRLKDLSAPDRLWQLGERAFPPIRSLQLARHNLPVRTDSFVGRDGDVEMVAEWLRESRLVTLAGLGGAGKSSLALASAARVVDRFPDGVFFVELAPLAEEAAIARAVGDAAGMRLDVVEPKGLEHTVVRFLADRSVLIVLDNCEHLIDGVAEFVSELLASGGTCRVLATSREALEVDGERVMRVSPLGLDDAVGLIIDRVTSVRGSYTPARGERDDLAAVAKALDGIPLALELAAAQLAHLSPADLVVRLGDRFELLGMRRGRRGRRRTLAAMMEWSWELLEADQRRVLAELATFVNGWSLSAAEAVCSRGADPIAVVLGDLYAKSLITRSERDGTVRFGMLETVRLYALERLAELVSKDEIQDRHARYFADDALPSTFVEREVWSSYRTLQSMLDDVENNRAAVEWLVARGRAAEAVPIMTVWSHITQLYRLPSSPAGDQLELMLASSLTGSHRAQALVAAAHVAWGRGDFAAVAANCEDAYELATIAGDHATASVAAAMQGFRYQIRDPQRCVELGKIAEAHAREADAPAVIRCVRGFTSMAYSFGLGQMERAIEICQGVLGETEPEGYDRGVVLTSLMAPLCMLGRWGEARAALQEAASILYGDSSTSAFFEHVERAVIAFETGGDPAPAYRLAWAHNNADGTSTTRPEHLLLPLARSIRDHDWARAGGIIDLIRDLSMQGVEFQTPSTVAMYLHYRNLAGDNPAEPVDCRFVEVVEHELSRTEAPDPMPLHAAQAGEANG